MNESQFALVIGFLVGFFFGLALQFHFVVRPLQETAIQKGYASYTITNSTHQTTSEFTWK